ncbi:hypothetical protein K2173_026673 [Erythroxylum novogranatense]|uniref:C2H2-type domain-containing protein n=1 Tax=Erythroxylum novogranatense TaxID=1862640 RepID=A0AAV8TY74_9ROSI|nr:hypothetical protein K2173_026673 [Erythroxylum novogranatense]
MPVAKLKASNTTDVMKPEEGNDSLDTFIRQAIGKEPFLSFSRANDSPVHWIQLLNALDQQDLPGWPLLTPLKVQMQKCDKCSREFCSSINYRRHIRVHHRLKKLDKDLVKNRHLLATFWDKLSEDKAKEILSFNDLSLEEVPGSSIVKSLTVLTRKPGFSSLPQNCLRAGSILLDIIQSRPTRFPLNSEELFSILDDASEKTFLCGSAVSMQKYVFDGEAGKIGLETKNLIACTSFLLEQKLVKAWLADKDAEALRCQKLLVEEEEAAQRRQATLLERKRQKKLRQKEQKAKEQRQDENINAKEQSDDGLDALPTAEESSQFSVSDTDTHGPDMMPDHVSLAGEHFPPPINNKVVDLEPQTGSSSGYTDLYAGHNSERCTDQGNGCRHVAVARWSMTRKLHRNNLTNGFHATHNVFPSKPGSYRDVKQVPILNGNKKWSRKVKPEYNGEVSRTGVEIEATSQLDQVKKSEVLIGSIYVTLGNSRHCEGNNLDETGDDCLVDHHVGKKHNVQEKFRHDDAHCVSNRSTVKLWRPVSRIGSGGPALIETSGRESQADESTGEGEEKPLSSDVCLRMCSVDDCGEMGSNPSVDENPLPGGLQFSGKLAKAFLEKRWNEAITAEHVTLVLTPNFEPPRCQEVQNGCLLADSQFSDTQNANPSGNDPNRFINIPAHDRTGAVNRQSRIKFERGVKLKYIPKHRNST